jgi:hypothetical protein
MSVDCPADRADGYVLAPPPEFMAAEVALPHRCRRCISVPIADVAHHLVIV